MLGFHMMHQNARERVFPLTRANEVGTLLMFAVRNIFSRPERLAAALRELTASGQLPRSLADASDPLGFLVHEGGAATITEAAYRFVRHEPGVDVVLFGTGNPDHLTRNRHLEALGITQPAQPAEGLPHNRAWRAER